MALDEQAAPVVSVIVPTYNRAGMLARSVVSALAQTYAALEVIVVDDASDDETPAVVRALADPRLRYLRLPENRGAAAARNAGIDAARGALVTFLDSDDRYRPDKVERQVRALGSADVVICACTTEGQPRIQRRFGKDRVELADLAKGYWFGGGASSILARASLLREIRFDESLRRDEDWELLLRIARRRHVIRYLDEPLVYYNNGSHPRITNAPVAGEGDEAGLRALYKHRDLVDPFWLSYHEAARLLSYLRSRRPLLKHLAATVRRCGVAPVGLALWHKVAGR